MEQHGAPGSRDQRIAPVDLALLRRDRSYLDRDMGDDLVLLRRLRGYRLVQHYDGPIGLVAFFSMTCGECDGPSLGTIEPGGRARWYCMRKVVADSRRKIVYVPYEPYAIVDPPD